MKRVNEWIYFASQCVFTAVAYAWLHEECTSSSYLVFKIFFIIYYMWTKFYILLLTLLCGLINISSHLCLTSLLLRGENVSSKISIYYCNHIFFLAKNFHFLFVIILKPPLKSQCLVNYTFIEKSTWWNISNCKIILYSNFTVNY